MAIFIAFEHYSLTKGILRSNFVGFNNFIRLFNDPIFHAALINTIIFTVVTVPYGIVIALILASLINSFSPPIQSIFRSAFYLPGVISGVILSMTWIWIFDPSIGLANMVLSFLHLPTLYWLHSPTTSLLSIMLSGMLMAPGGSIILYLAGMSRIPREFYEAAELDGATSFQKWINVTIPLLEPTTLFLLVTNTIGSFQIFTSVYVMTSGGPGYSSDVLGYDIYNRAFNFYNFGQASAESLVLWAIVGTFAIFEFRRFSKVVKF
ncbi:MAG: sugar ABC transporter permease [Candidatus Methanomethylicia archaeon]